MNLLTYLDGYGIECNRHRCINCSPIGWVGYYFKKSDRCRTA